ncbi:MAG: RipA family octameric membrane protein [Promethearchaeia archaeon]
MLFINKEEYNEKFKEHLLEQYKLYVEMADRISKRREHTNKLYISLLTVVFALFSIIIKGEKLNEFQIFIFITINIFGILLCILWIINIYSYKKLNWGKFKVIHEMEQNLPFGCYKREWEILGKGKESKKYRPLTHVEQLIPLIFILLYLFFLISILLLIL